MKKVSLKIKLTLLYTIFILVVVGTVLGILFSLSGREILASTKMSLERRVEESLEEIEMQDGELKIDSDFYSVENGVYLSMYDSTGYFLYGKIPGAIFILNHVGCFSLTSAIVTPPPAPRCLSAPPALAAAAALNPR